MGCFPKHKAPYAWVCFVGWTSWPSSLTSQWVGGDLCLEILKVWDWPRKEFRVWPRVLDGFRAHANIWGIYACGVVVHLDSVCVFLCMFLLWNTNLDQPGRRNKSGQSMFIFTWVLLVFAWQRIKRYLCWCVWLTVFMCCVSASLDHLLEQQTGAAANKPREGIFWVLSPPDSASLKNDIMQSKQQIIPKTASLWLLGDNAFFLNIYLFPPIVFWKQ